MGLGEERINEEKNECFSPDDALEMVFCFDEKGMVVCANRAAKQKLEYGEELYGTHISEIFPNSFHATDNGFQTEYEFGEKQQELMAYRKNRTCFCVEVKILKRNQGKKAYLCMANDASKQDFLEKEIISVGRKAEQALKVKSEFVANVTHELRTPVNGILGNTQELLELEKDEKNLKILRLIERGCEDMNDIINNILDFSKLEAGKFTLELRKFHFRNMMDYVKANHIRKITEKGLDFFMTISPQIPEYVIGDELRIVQVLNNLLSNAYKFTAVGKIAVEVVRTAQINNRIELFFLVSDSGIGIDKADQDKLFKSFSQVDASISRQYGGTGLGLNICKQLVELMGGSISVDSTKNRGSVFSFSIWIEVPEEEMAEMPVNEDFPITLGQKINLRQNVEEADVRNYGTQENLEEMKNKMSKFILSVEMENWEKAEMFADVMKQLTAEAPKEIRNAVLKLKMAVQKEDYDKVQAAFEALQTLL